MAENMIPGVSKPLPPFSCTYSPNMPELLMQLKCTLALSTYQAGKVIFISATNAENLIQLPRNFSKPMGIAMQGNKLAVATKDEVVVLGGDASLASGHPKHPGVYDSLYVPRATYYTGQLDLHDLSYTPKGLLGVNTRFSCLSIIDEAYSFTPVWQPSFITQLSPEDRCHLNGMAMVNQQPKYVTALGISDTQGGWRTNKANGGALIDVESNEIILKGLPMPHSPRIYEGKTYLLLSATGELGCVDTQQGKYEVVKTLNGFVRGMDRHGDYLFIGLSKIREESTAFGDLPIAKKSVFCGIVALHLPTGSIAGHIRYENSVEEIYDVKILPGLQRPGLLSPEKEEHKHALVTPTDTYWAIIDAEVSKNKEIKTS